MSIDKSVIRTSLIPSLIKVYEYNKARKVKDIFLYEISKTYYDSSYIEESKITILMAGNYYGSSSKTYNIVIYTSSIFLCKGLQK